MVTLFTRATPGTPASVLIKLTSHRAYNCCFIIKKNTVYSLTMHIVTIFMNNLEMKVSSHATDDGLIIL